jgi:hypothetical protein
MSLLKSNSVQIGQSATATQNFTLSVPASPDGTIKLARGNSGATTSDILSVSSSGAVTINNLNNQSFRNRIINGDMRIWQRGTTGFTTTNSGTYVADRMYMFSGVGTTATASQVTSTTLSGFPFATRIQRNSGNTGTNDVICLQAIETVNCQDLAGSTVTVSFYARAGSNYSAGSNNLLALVATGSASDQGVIEWIAQRWTGQLTATVGTAVLTTSWQRFSYSYTVPAGTNEIILGFNSPRLGTAGANDFFDITGVQLESGSTATEFERRPIGTELALCQRYYWRPAANTSLGRCSDGSSLWQAAVFMKQTMRSAPTLEAGSTYAAGGGANGTPIQATGNVSTTASADSIYLYNSSGNWSAGNGIAFNGAFSSEL